MGEDIYNYEDSYGDIFVRINDLEEKQRNLKNRLILVGQNLIDFKQETSQKITEIKKQIEIMKNNLEKTTSIIESLASEFPKFAKKEDVEILAKQAKMFQPLNYLKKK